MQGAARTNKRKNKEKIGSRRKKEKEMETNIKVRRKLEKERANEMGGKKRGVKK